MDGKEWLQRAAEAVRASHKASCAAREWRRTMGEQSEVLGSPQRQEWPRTRPPRRHYGFRIRNCCFAAAPGGAITRMRLGYAESAHQISSTSIYVFYYSIKLPPCDFFLIRLTNKIHDSIPPPAAEIAVLKLLIADLPADLLQEPLATAIRLATSQLHGMSMVQ